MYLHQKVEHPAIYGLEDAINIHVIIDTSSLP